MSNYKSKNIRPLNNIVQISNLAFLIPLYLAFIKHDVAYIFILAFLITSSFLYHRSIEIKYFYFDLTAALLLISYNFYQFYGYGFLNTRFLATLVFIFVSFYYYFKSYKQNFDLNHSLWHLVSVIITILSMTT